MSDNNVHNILLERAFRDAHEIGAALGVQARDWDHNYVLKELGLAHREMIEKIEPTDVERLYPLGLKLHALSLLFVTKLLEADARGDFDGVDICMHDRESAWENREGGLIWCRECQEYLERTADGWRHKPCGQCEDKQ